MTVALKKETIEGGFKVAFDSLPHNKRKESRDEICERCYWMPWTFRSALSGGRPFRTFEKQQIEIFFAKYNLNAWTGEEII
jgi:hypothetical protein